MKNIYEIKIQEPELLNEIGTLISNLTEMLNLNGKWNHFEFKDIELKKCFIRGVIRESSFVGTLQKQVVLNLNKKILFKNYNFFSKFYPMVHLPGDISESSKYLHYDEEGNKEIFTCWMPLTKNQYNEISVFKYENYLVLILNKLLTKFSISNIFSEKLKSKYGFIYVWSGKRLHKGNLNISNKLSCAIQMKISKQKLIKEYYKTSELKENFFNNRKKLRDKKSYLESFEKLNVLVEHLDCLKNNELKKFRDLIKKIKDLIDNNITQDFQELSFCLSVFSQRMRIQSKKNYENLFSCFCYDIASVLLGSTNKISLFRIQDEINIFYQKDYKKYNFQDISELKNKILELD